MVVKFDDRFRRQKTRIDYEMNKEIGFTVYAPKIASKVPLARL